MEDKDKIICEKDLKDIDFLSFWILAEPIFSERVKKILDKQNLKVFDILKDWFCERRRKWEELHI